MSTSPLAPVPGRGLETAMLEKAPPPEPEEIAALQTVWGHLAPAERRGRRDLLLPALIALQEARGWISYPALAAVCLELTVPLADAYGVASFYGLLSTVPGPRRMIHVCDDVACRLKGAEALKDALEKWLGPPHRSRQVDRDEGLAGDGAGEDGEQPAWGWAASPCLGQCDRAPAVLFGSDIMAQVSSDVLEKRLAAEGNGVRANGAPSLAPAPEPAHVGSLGAGTPLLLRRCQGQGARDLDAYLASGGYAGLRRALDIGAEATRDEVRQARLVGRGGAAFPAAVKWDAVAREQAPRYVVCNADESEPGTFKDRVLLEQDPFAILEGMTIAAWAVGAEKGYLYLRGEYTQARTILERAIQEARSRGYLGANILGSGFSFDVEMRLGAGAYVCGEETALFNSIEGYRGEPRPRPPYPTQVGLFGRPTVINNVETLACVPPILTQGGTWYASIGTEGSAGTKLVSISGHVRRPGVYEVAFGTPIRTIIEELAGGVPEGRSVQAVLCGGAAGTFLTPEELDTPLAFETLRAMGATVGSGALVVYDDTADLWDAVERLTRFFMEESCGQCVPCRVGTRRQWEWVRAQRRKGPGTGSHGDEGGADELLTDLAAVMRDASICGLGQLAPNALHSALRLLRPRRGDGNGGEKR